MNNKNENPYVYDRTLYKYRSIENAKKLLETESLYFNCPSQFNDPFEFSDRLLDTSFSEKFAQSHIGGLPQIQSLPRKERRNLKRKDLSTHMRLGVKQAIEGKRNEFGVFCGSEIYDSTLMWSHYADNHKGVCIGFEFPQTKEFLDNFVAKENIIPMKVSYVDNIVKAPCEVNGELFPESTLRHWFSTKSKVWEYEQEIRLLKIDGKASVSFSPNWIREIYFGLLVPDNHIEEIISIVNAKCDSCLLFDMKFANNSFQLIRKQHKKRGSISV